MKIAYVLTTYPSRTETFASREIDSLRRRGVDIKVLAAVGSEVLTQNSQCRHVRYRPALLSRSSILAIVYLLRKYPIGIYRLFALILKIIRRHPQEAKSILANIHTIGYFAGYLDQENISHIHAYFLNWPSCIAMALSRMTGRTYSMAGHARDIFVESGALEAKVASAQFVTVCTRQALDYLKIHLPTELHHKIHLIYHGINLSNTNPHSNEDLSDEKVEDMVIAISRFVPKKGLAHLLRAFSKVRKVRPACLLIIAGDGPLRGELEQTASRLNITDAVWFLGWHKQDLLLQYLQAATVLVAPSVSAADGDRDGIPNVILEAFACEVPVIAGNIGGISEAVQDRKTGLLVAPGNERQLTNAIVELLSDKQLRNRLSQNAYISLTKHFNIEENVKTMADLLRNTC